MQDYSVVWLLQFIGAISSFPSLLSGAIGFDSLTLLSRSCREVPAYAAFYGTFEASKRALTPKGAKPSNLAIHWVMFSGSVAGVGYWTACYPLDLIKTKIQSEPLVGPNSSARAPSIISVGAKDCQVTRCSRALEGICYVYHTYYFSWSCHIHCI
jgi:hypothetical protein